MNFLKISGLVIGTGSVVGGTGAGIYYVVNKNTKEEKSETTEDKKTQFDGKLVFEKNEDNNYETKLFTELQHTDKKTEFDKNKGETDKYEKINKIVEISCQINVENTQQKLEEIFGTEYTWEDAKAKILSKSEDLKGLFGEAIYENLKTLIS